MSRFCPRCNRPLVIFRGFWQCKHCIEEKELYKKHSKKYGLTVEQLKYLDECIKKESEGKEDE